MIRTSRRHTTAGSLNPALGAPVRSEGGKYRNVPVIVDGVRFASKKEARRYGELRLLERTGQIIDLRLQPRYPLKVNGVKIGAIVPDFAYIENGEPVEEDVKSPITITPIFKWKSAHFKAQYGREIRLIR